MVFLRTVSSRSPLLNGSGLARFPCEQVVGRERQTWRSRRRLVLCMVPPSLNNSKSSDDMPRWRHSRCSSWGSDAPSVLCTSVLSLCPPCPLHNTGRPQVRPREAEACQAPDRPCAGPSSRRAGGLGPLHRLHLLPPRPGDKSKVACKPHFSSHKGCDRNGAE